VQVISETWPPGAFLVPFLPWKKELVVRARKPGLLNILFTSTFYCSVKTVVRSDKQSDKNKKNKEKKL